MARVQDVSFFEVRLNVRNCIAVVWIKGLWKRDMFTTLLIRQGASNKKVEIFLIQKLKTLQEDGFLFDEIC